MKKNNLFLLSFLVFFILSCSNLFEHEAANNEAGNAKYLTVTGSLSSELDSGAVPRSAFPANSINLASYTTNIYYKTSADAETRTLCGTSAGVSSFELKLPSFGDYFLEAESYLTSDATKTIKLKTLTSTQITLNEAVPYKNDVSLFLTVVPSNNSSSKGSIKLYFQSFDSSSVRKVNIYEENDPTAVGSITFGNTDAQEWESEADIGVCSYIFKFYSDSYGTKLVYQCTEKVTVLSGMTTDTWVNNGNAEYFAQVTVNGEQKTVMSITQTCLNNFALTNFYVSSESGNDSNNGSYFAPLKTIQKALDKCTDSSKEYTINLNGTFEPSAKLTVTNKVKIQKAEGAATAAIVRPVSGHTTSMISVETGAVCTIKDIIIDGSSVGLTSVAGAGINNAGTVTLKNCIIRNCFTDFNGGAIFSVDGSLYIEDTVIGDASKATVATSGNCSNKANQGAGIFFNQNNRVNKLKISGNTKIIGNYAAANGGGCYFYISNFDNIDVRAQFAISYCAANKGGGIYIDGGRFELKENTSISHCAATGNGGNGGGININEGKIIMSGGSITDCSADRGAGVYVNATFEMSGGNISGCTATTFGSGVYVDEDKNEDENAVFNMSGSAYIASNNDVYLKDKTIEITGDLTSEALPVAVVTIPSNMYGTSTTVLTGTNTLLLDNYYKIDVNPNGSVGGYIGSNGKLCRITNYVADAKIIRDLKNFDSTSEAYSVGSGKTVFIVSNMNIDRELMVNGTVLVPSDISSVKMTFTTPGKRIITTSDTVNIGSLNGGKLILDGNKGAEASHGSKALITIQNSSNVYLKNVDLQNNYTTMYGGAIRFDANQINLHMTKCSIHDCYANNSGGAIYVYSNGSIYLNETEIKDNEANLNGGAIFTNSSEFKIYFDLEDSVSNASSIKTNISNKKNLANTYGGGIYLQNGILIINKNIKVDISENKCNSSNSQIFVPNTGAANYVLSDTTDYSSETLRVLGPGTLKNVPWS